VRKGQRFDALDSWRGIAACMVALFHHPAFTDANALIEHSYLFVDLFFVLSGFVIAANYQDRLSNGFSIGRFMWLRLGRLYPLHIAVFAAYIAHRLISQKPFSPKESPETILANLTLTQGMNLFDFLTWNYPSWSVGAEFFTYAIFAGVVVALGRKAWIAMLAAVLACPVILYVLKGHIVATYDYSLIRCIYGFALGVLTLSVFQRHRVGGTALEVAAVILMGVFVAVNGKEASSLAAPLVFAVLVYVFASEDGVLSIALKQRPFLLLGTLSYSIYMLHAMIAPRIPEPYHWAYLPIVVASAWVSYRLIEAPARGWFRRHGVPDFPLARARP
jgi:peptidoglycan/LPS O-acetylase OafA/YrhL